MVTGSVEKIRVVLQAMTAGFGRSLTRAQAQLKKSTRGMQDFGHVMQTPISNLKTLDKNSKVMRTSGGRLAFGMRKATHGMRGFRMEMLGVMFFGMMLQRTFTGLLKTSTQWMGVNKVMTSALGLLFLPVAERILDWALKFLDWVGQLTEAQKLWIGKLVVLGVVIGGITFLIGTFALGIGSLILAFKGLFAPISLVIGALVAFGILKTLKGDLIDFGDDVELVSMGIQMNFSKIPEFLRNLVQKIGSWLRENKDKILDTGREIFQNIINGLHENREAIGEFIESLIANIGRWIGKNAEKFIELGVTIGKYIVKGILTAVWEIGKGLGEAYVSFLERFRTSNVGRILFARSYAIGQARAGVPSFQKGGVMPHTGLAHLHAGETIIPAGQSGGSGVVNITINADVASDYDVRKIAEELKRYWVSDFERVSQGRTI